jgi:hypothetical protein
LDANSMSDISVEAKLKTPAISGDLAGASRE